MRKIMKRIMALTLICSISMSMGITSAIAQETPDNNVLPDGIILLEGETWIPASEITSYEAENHDCGVSGHVAPAGYRYAGAINGNTHFEKKMLNGMLGAIAAIPGMKAITFIIKAGSWIAEYIEDSDIDGEYYKYQWTSGSSFWTHVVCYGPTTSQDFAEGEWRYVACEIDEYTP